MRVVGTINELGLPAGVGPPWWTRPVRVMNWNLARSRGPVVNSAAKSVQSKWPGWSAGGVPRPGVCPATRLQPLGFESWYANPWIKG